MSFICESIVNKASNVGQIYAVIGNFAHGQISLIVRTNWGMEVAPEASKAMGVAFTSWMMSRGTRFMSFICESMTMGGSTSSNSGQIVGKGGAKFAYRLLELGRGSGS